MVCPWLKGTCSPRWEVPKGTVMLRGARHESYVVVSACLRSASSALEMLRPMQGHSAPPATSTTHQLAAQPRKVRLSFRKRSTDVEKAGQHDWRFATTADASRTKPGRFAHCFKVAGPLFISWPSTARSGEWPAWFSFWFSGCWRALAKGTAWAVFYCVILLLTWNGLGGFKFNSSSS